MSITTNEMNYLKESMKRLLEEYDYNYTDDAITYIIDEWYYQKRDIISLLKKDPNYIPGQFMVVKETTTERYIDSNESIRFYSWLCDNAMYKCCNSLPPEVMARKSTYQLLPPDLSFFFNNLDDYAERTISESTCALLERIVPEIHPHVGQKTSRVVNKICTYLGYDKVDGYARAFAKYADSLSPITIKRKTILSVNPLDYLTMSFGNSWASCHTIDKNNKRGMPNSYEGMYSSGTISYMLDGTSMVLYTVSESYNGKEYWSQPKVTRQMFHFGQEKLIQGRLYPQDNDGCTSEYDINRQIVQKIIAECLSIPNLWTVRKGTSAACEYIISRGTNYPDYRHFDNCTLSRICGSQNGTDIIVGARPICIECGNRHDEERNINCCSGDHYYCQDCGQALNEDDVFWIGGEPYCRECVYYCEYCDEYHRNEEYYVASEDRYICEDCFYRYYERCSVCGEILPREDSHYIDSRNEWVCPECFDEHYRTCKGCGEYFFLSDLKETEDGHFYCDYCYEEKEESDDE